MKPKIGKDIYVIGCAQGSYYIFKEKVGFLGAESFVVQDYYSKTSIEYWYDNYGIEWFLSLNAAKARANKARGKRVNWDETIKDEMWDEEEQ